jgi:hypothetical protein
MSVIDTCNYFVVRLCVCTVREAQKDLKVKLALSVVLGVYCLPSCDLKENPRPNFEGPHVQASTRGGAAPSNGGLPSNMSKRGNSKDGFRTIANRLAYV